MVNHTRKTDIFITARISDLSVTYLLCIFYDLDICLLFVFARILNLFAEENAVEDTIYYLSESLRKEAIDLEVFLKVTQQYI